MGFCDRCQNGLWKIQHKIADRMRLQRWPVLLHCMAEFLGTMVLIIFGNGVAAQRTLGNLGQQEGGTFLSVSLGWGMAVTFGVFIAGVHAPAQLNPALTLSFAVIGKVKWILVPIIMLAQLFGGFIGALTVYGIYEERLHQYADLNDGGKFLVSTTGSIFVTIPDGISNMAAFLDQVLGSMILAMLYLAVTDKNGWNIPKSLVPMYLGLLVFTMVGALGLNAGAALNPARDLGPRIAIAMTGWGISAFTDVDYYFWVPIFGPYLGALIGSVIYELLVGMHFQNAGDFQPEDMDEDEEIRSS